MSIETAKIWKRPSAVSRLLAAFCMSSLLYSPPLAAQDDTPPDIIFVILDDAGIDQFTVFGNGGIDPPLVPNINTIADEGLKFTNAWATPECSPSRSAFFTGRWGLRTGVTTALIPKMLPQAQVSPYEVTLPRLLRTAGYHSAMMGKYHLGSANPSGNCSPATRGFDYFQGNMEAGPPAIDTQAGSDSVPDGTYDCGFVRREGDQNLAEIGACYFSDQSCQSSVIGKACLQQGGLLIARQACQPEVPEQLDFDRTNGYYVWPNTPNQGSLPAPMDCASRGSGCANLTCPISSSEEPQLQREYMSDTQTRDAITWWQQQAGPKMLTVSYNSIHTPYQQPPGDGGQEEPDTAQCQGDDLQRFPDTFTLINSMFKSVDQLIADLLAGLSVASLDANGLVDELYLDEMNTMLVIIGDNGSFAPSVRLPYDPLRSKGSVFQTGVLVPLIIAGPLVRGERGREVSDMVNGADLYQLFAQFAGIDPAVVVPPAHRLDSVDMMPYLKDAEAPTVRQYNYTEVSGDNTLPTPVDPSSRLWPCVLLGNVTTDESGSTSISGGFCNDLLFDTPSFCTTNTGVWFGPGTDYPNPGATLPENPDGAWGSCCAVYDALSNPDNPMGLSPISQRAAQNGTFKLIEITIANCEAPVDDPKIFPPYERFTAEQFYNIAAVPADYDRSELCGQADQIAENMGLPQRCTDGESRAGLPKGNACANAPQCLAPFPALAKNYSPLDAYLNGLAQSAISCLGDGNLDKRVTQLDVDGVMNFTGAGPSYFDFNRDGETDELDLAIAQQNLGTDCLGACKRADLNRDNRVTRADSAILTQAYGPCDADLVADTHLCSGDLNGDGQVNREDLLLLNRTRKTFDAEICPHTVAGQNDPEADKAAIQNAIDLAQLDPGGGRVILEGEFDLGDCSFCINIHGPVTIQGLVDPSNLKQAMSLGVTIIRSGGVAPFVISDQSNGEGVIRIERLWFDGGLGLAVEISQIRGRVELIDNRVSGYSSFSYQGIDHRFAFASAGLAPGSGELQGEFLALGNYIDNRDIPFEVGDDNGISLAHCQFSLIEIIENDVYTRGESISLEDCANPQARVDIAHNTVISDAAISVRAQTSVPVGLDGNGGHPAAIKVAAGEAASLSIRGNSIELSGASTAVCILPGLLNEAADILIRRNHCSMDGQFAGLLAGWSGTPARFPPFYLQNARVALNRFEGTAYLGIGFVDFIYEGENPDGIENLANQGHDNTFQGNDLSGLTAERAALYFGPYTYNNVFRGNRGGLAEDHGTGNTVSGPSN